MTMNVRQHSLADAARLPRNLERKDGDASLVEIKKNIEDFMKGFETFKQKNDAELAELKKTGSADVVRKEEMDRLSKALDELKADINKEITKLNRPKLTDAKGNEISQELADYSKNFEVYLRKGERAIEGGEAGLRAMEQKAMAVSSDTDGGYTARPELETAIDQTVKLVSPIRQLASVRQIGALNYKKLVSVHGTASGWVGEQDTRAQTQAPQLKEVDFPAMEIYAMPAATQTLLDDSFVNIDQWLADEVSLEFAYQEGKAFVSGNGVKQPFGLLSYNNVADSSYAWGSVGYKTTGVSGGFAAAPNGGDCLIDLYHALKAPYRGTATWLMSTATLAAVRKLKDSNGAYLINAKITFQTDGTGAFIENIMGKPVVEVPDMPDPAANSFSIAFGDIKRAYLIVDRVGVRVLRDPYSAKPYVLFYTTKRVGGGVQNYEAFKLLKFA